MQNLGRPKITPVTPDVDWGVYLWRLPDGNLFKDDDNNYLNIRSREYDLEKMQEMREAAAYYGKPEGELYFKAGVEQATDDEHQRQKEMMRSGEIHERDYGALMDEKRAAAVGL